MKVTIDFDDEILKDAIQMHLDTGIKVQDYIIAAVKLFKDLYGKEKTGKYKIGFGDSSRFETYNTVTSPSTYLENSQIKRNGE